MDPFCQKRERERGEGRWEGKELEGFYCKKKRDMRPNVPGLRDNNVVDWLVALAEAREADFDNHVVVVFWGGRGGSP
jgi:hypothetical protein